MMAELTEPAHAFWNLGGQAPSRRFDHEVTTKMRRLHRVRGRYPLVVLWLGLIGALGEVSASVFGRGPHPYVGGEVP